MKKVSDKFRDLHKEYLELDVWSKAHSLMREAGLDDRLFFKHPIKSPFLEIYDNLLALADEIEARENTLDNQ